MDKLKDYLPILTVYLLIIGNIYASNYYKNFNIIISPYLDFSEIFQLQFGFYKILPLIIFGIYYAATMTLFSVISTKNYFAKINKKRAAKVVKSDVDVALLNTEVEEEIGPNFDSMLQRFFNYLQTNPKIGVSILMVFGYVIALYLPDFAASRVIYSGNHTEVVMKLEKQTIRTNKDTLFIGQTKNYLFFYSRHSKESTVYKMSDVKEIKFRPGLARP